MRLNEDRNLWVVSPPSGSLHHPFALEVRLMGVLGDGSKDLIGHFMRQGDFKEGIAAYSQERPPRFGDPAISEKVAVSGVS